VWGALWLAPDYAFAARVNGDVATALRVLDHAIDVARERGVVVLGTVACLERAVVHVITGDAAGARADRDAALAGVAIDNPAWPGLASRVAMIDGLLLVRDDPVAGAALCDATAERFAALGLPWLEAEIRLLAGRALRATGQDAGADAMLAAARAVYERIGASPRWIGRTEQEADG
jgi:hypothetical protein